MDTKGSLQESSAVFGFLRRIVKGRGEASPTTPLSPFQHPRQIEEGISEMIMVIRKVLADGVVTEEEAVALSEWTERRPEVVEAWPGKVLAHRFERIFEDGDVDPDEREDLQRLLRALAAGDWGVRLGGSIPGGVPLTEPPPVLIFPEQSFVFTGEFAYGSVSSCEDAVARLGGRTSSEVTEETDVLVIGTFGAREWGESPEAKMIERALTLRRRGHSISVVSEDYWASSLPAD